MSTTELRPRIWQGKNVALFFILAIAIAGALTAALLATDATLEGEIVNGRITLHSPPPIWYRVLVTSLFTSLFTISIYELLSLALQYGIWSRRERRKFDQFFGDDASNESGSGLIFLQADKIDRLLVEYGLPDIKQAIDSKPSGRLYKARQWMNYFDTVGAREVIQHFRDRGLDAPQLVPLERPATIKEEVRVSGGPPFTITMGLGFSIETHTLLKEACAGWMKVSYEAPYGDVLELLQNLVPNELKLLKFEDASSGFRRLLPNGDWKLSSWLADGAVRDYALILRHTEVHDGRRHQKFVLAGFTERGTAAAGEYLARNWQKLWHEYVKEDYAKPGLGDFLLIIEGPSNWGDIKEWTVDPYLKAVTPARLATDAPFLTTPWVKRFAPVVSSG